MAATVRGDNSKRERVVTSNHLARGDIYINSHAHTYIVLMTLEPFSTLYVFAEMSSSSIYILVGRR